MELTHDFTVPAPIEEAWAAFMDLERVAGCFPGAMIASVTDEEFAGQVKVKLGPIQLLYMGQGRFVERDDASHHAVIEAKGKDKRGNGTAGATVTVRLSPGSNDTRVDVITDLSITGKPAQFGRGVMQDVSDKLLQQFIACIEATFSAAPEPMSESETSDTETHAVAAPDASSLPPEPETLPSTHAPRTPPSEREPLDLGATVFPVVLRSYAPHLAGAVVIFVVGYLLGRRRG